MYFFCFIYVTVLTLVAAHGTFVALCGISSCGTWILVMVWAPEHMGSVFVVWTSLLCDMWALSSPTRNRTYVPIPCIARQIFNHWTTREALILYSFPWFGRNLLSFLNCIYLVFLFFLCSYQAIWYLKLNFALITFCFIREGLTICGVGRKAGGRENFFSS